MRYALGVEIRKAFQHLHAIYLCDVFVLDTSELQESRQTSALTKLLKDVDLVSVHFDPVVLDNIGMAQHLHYAKLVTDLLVKTWRASKLLELDLLHRHQGTGV